MDDQLADFPTLDNFRRSDGFVKRLAYGVNHCYATLELLKGTAHVEMTARKMSGFTDTMIFEADGLEVMFIHNRQATAMLYVKVKSKLEYENLKRRMGIIG